MPVKLHAPQEKAVAQMHNGCILYGDVGVGKTITSLAYYFERVCGGTLNKWESMTTPKDLIVITTAKVRDSLTFEIQASKMGIHTDAAISTGGVKLTVDSWNNLHKYTGVSDAFFIFDEQRVVGYGAWSKAFIKIAKSNEWILLSATPGDTWMDYIPVFIANGWYRNKTHFLDEHVIWMPRVKFPKVLRYQNVGELVRRRNDVLVHMPVERHTIRHAVDVDCAYDEVAFERAVKKRWHVFENRPLRDVGELFSVMRRIVNSDASRIRSVENLLQKHPKLIVFYNFDYELEMLRTLVPEDQLASPESIKQLKQRVDSQPKPNSESSSPSRTDRSAGKSESGSGSKNTPTISSSNSTNSEWLDTSSAELRSTEFDTSNDTSMLGKSFAVAEWNGHKHEQIPATERWLYLVQYRAGAEGWNCIETDAICFYSQTYSYRDWWQAHGRIDRINTPFVHLWYYHLISRSLIDKAIRKALRTKKSFNERYLKVGWEDR